MHSKFYWKTSCFYTPVFPVMDILSLCKVAGLLAIFILCFNHNKAEVQPFTEAGYEAANTFEGFTASSHFYGNSKSTGNCHSSSGCLRATVYDLKSTSKPSGSTRTIPLVPKRSYFNNRPKELKDQYLVNESLTETATLELSQAFRHVDSINFEDTVLAIFQASESTALRKLTAGLPTAYQIESISKQTRRYGVAAKKVYQFERAVTVSYCEEYEISTAVEMVDNAKTRYRAKLKITGEDSNTGRKLTAKEIRDSLDAAHDGLTFLQGNSNGDDFTAIAATYVSLRETYVSKDVSEGKGKPIKECLDALPLIYKANVLSFTKTSSNTGTTRDETITYKSTFINNGKWQETHNASFNYFGRSRISDSSEFEFSKSLNRIKYISLENSAIASLKNSLETPLRKSTAKLLEKLPTAFQKGSSSKSYVVEDERWIDTKEIVPISSCKKDEREFAVKVVEGVETNYRVQANITGELDIVGKRISAAEIRNGLKDEMELKFLHNDDEFTVVAETSATLVENYVDNVFSTHNTEDIITFKCN